MLNKIIYKMLASMPQEISSDSCLIKREPDANSGRSRHCDSWFRADTTGNFWEGALGVNAEVRRPAYFLSQRILAEDEKFLPEKFHVIFIGIVYLLRGENKVGCISGFFCAEFYLSRSR